MDAPWIDGPANEGDPEYEAFMNRQAMELYLERFESGEPLRDWYDEIQVQEMLATAFRQILSDEDSER